jgi:hypothetical protein
MIQNPGAQVGVIMRNICDTYGSTITISIVQRPMAPAQATLARLIDAWALYVTIEEDDDSRIVLPKKKKNSSRRRTLGTP